MFYDTDQKKIAFTLSFMTGGAAAPWREAKITEYGTTAWPTWDVFKTAFTDMFTPVSDQGAARSELKNLTQDGPINDYITQFQTIIG